MNDNKPLYSTRHPKPLILIRIFWRFYYWLWGMWLTKSNLEQKAISHEEFIATKIINGRFTSYTGRIKEGKFKVRKVEKGKL